MLPGQVLRANGEPVAQNTRLGWVVAGNIKDSQITNLTSANLNLYDDLKRFWEIESTPAAKTLDLTPEEKFCEEHFLSNSKINSDGRFEVKLPFLKTNLKLGNSYNGALLRLKAMERRFLQDPEICKLYKQFMLEYIDLGHMKRTEDDLDEIHDHGKFYLPHHFVLKNSTTTKFQAVFDGSYKTENSVSLNEMLEVGAKQRDIFEMLLDFRIGNFAVTADITKMYRQQSFVSIHKTWEVADFGGMGQTFFIKILTIGHLKILHLNESLRNCLNKEVTYFFKILHN
ncbi:reverse transcriptase [Caerostris darwini]|uniref:Reverse transcriptase n=1 Tax=Caerostris darwini TaxID=1538125 RepID=A0AAV4WBK5_9ARAC|nr:reverse transcriptase [Caerostris darwini]